jgi:hypothetical protein
VTVVADLLLLAAGHGLLVAVAGRSRGHLGVAGRIGLSFLCGVALLGAVTTLLAVAGLPTTRPAVTPFLVVAALGALLPLRTRFQRVPYPPLRALAAEAAAALAAVAVGARAVVAGARLPVVANDEYAIWAMRGRLLSLAGRFDQRIGFGTAAGYQHADYPLTVPGLIAWADGWSGGSDGAAHAQVALVFAAMLLVGGWVGARYAGVAGGVAAVLLLGGLGRVLPRYGVLLFADVPVAAFAVALVSVAAVWLDERDGRLLGVAAVLAAGAALTKNEGALAVVAVLAAAALANAGRAREWRPLLVAAGVAVAALLPWLAFTRLHGVASDVANGDTLAPSALLTNTRLVGPTLTGFRTLWPGLAGLPLLLAAVAALLALAARQWRLTVLFAGALALELAGLLVIYLGGHNHLYSSAHRTLLAPAAILAVAVPVLAGAATRRRDGA